MNILHLNISHFHDIYWLRTHCVKALTHSKNSAKVNISLPTSSLWQPTKQKLLLINIASDRELSTVAVVIHTLLDMEYKPSNHKEHKHATCSEFWANTLWVLGRANHELESLEV